MGSIIVYIYIIIQQFLQINQKIYMLCKSRTYKTIFFICVFFSLIVSFFSLVSLLLKFIMARYASNM